MEIYQVVGLGSVHSSEICYTSKKVLKKMAPGVVGFVKKSCSTSMQSL